MASREAVMLYRAILRQARRLRFTDRDYFRRTVRQEFQKNRQPEEIEFQIEVYVTLTLIIDQDQWICYFYSTESKAFSIYRTWRNFMKVQDNDNHNELECRAILAGLHKQDL